ncbi:MAG TPA: toll/interleukin-1 receptor domain-containing protein [Kofleriaceae bacterium]
MMTSPRDTTRRYRAFLSYSHAADDRFAEALQKALKQFARPLFAVRALNIFRDRTDLSATPELWNSVRSALDDSDYLIYLASPKAAGSRWVKRELDHWIRTRSTLATLLIVLTDGELKWEGADFDWSQTTSLPRLLDFPELAGEAPLSLEQRFGSEPGWVDMKALRDQALRDAASVSLGNLAFREAVAALAAPLHGKRKPDLLDEDQDNARRSRRTRRIVTAALGSLIASLGVAFWTIKGDKKTLDIELQNRTLAERDREIAGIQSAVRKAEQLMSTVGHEWEGRALLITERARLIQLAASQSPASASEVETWKLVDGAVLVANHGVQVQLHAASGARFGSAKLIAGDRFLAVLERFGDDASVHVIDVSDGRDLLDVDGVIGSIAAPSPMARGDQQYILALDDGRIVTRDARGGLNVAAALRNVTSGGESPQRWLSEDGRRLFVARATRTGAEFELYDLPGGTLLERGRLPEEDVPARVIIGAELPSPHVVFPGFPYVYTWEPASRKWQSIGPFPGMRGIANSVDGRSLYIVGENFPPRLVEANRATTELPDQMYGVQRVMTFPDDAHYLLTIGGRIAGFGIASASCALYLWARGEKPRQYRSFLVEDMDCPEPAIAVARQGMFAYGRPGRPIVVRSVQGHIAATLDQVASARDPADALALTLSESGRSIVIQTDHDVLLVDLPPYDNTGDVRGELATMCGRLPHQRIVNVPTRELDLACREH